jgi:hypothetical protein
MVSELSPSRQVRALEVCELDTATTLPEMR